MKAYEKENTRKEQLMKSWSRVKLKVWLYQMFRFHDANDEWNNEKLKYNLSALFDINFLTYQFSTIRQNVRYVLISATITVHSSLVFIPTSYILLFYFYSYATNNKQ